MQSMKVNLDTKLTLSSEAGVEATVKNPGLM